MGSNARQAVTLLLGHEGGQLMADTGEDTGAKHLMVRGCCDHQGPRGVGGGGSGGNHYLFSRIFADDDLLNAIIMSSDRSFLRCLALLCYT